MVLAGGAGCAVARRRNSYGLSEKDQSVDAVVGDMEILSSGMENDEGTVAIKFAIILLHSRVSAYLQFCTTPVAMNSR